MLKQKLLSLDKTCLKTFSFLNYPADKLSALHIFWYRPWLESLNAQDREDDRPGGRDKDKYERDAHSTECVRSQTDHRRHREIPVRRTHGVVVTTHDHKGADQHHEYARFSYSLGRFYTRSLFDRKNRITLVSSLSAETVENVMRYRCYKGE